MLAVEALRTLSSLNQAAAASSNKGGEACAKLTAVKLAEKLSGKLRLDDCKQKLSRECVEHLVVRLVLSRRLAAAARGAARAAAAARDAARLLYGEHGAAALGALLCELPLRTLTLAQRELQQRGEGAAQLCARVLPDGGVRRQQLEL